MTQVPPQTEAGQVAGAQDIGVQAEQVTPTPQPITQTATAQADEANEGMEINHQDPVPADNRVPSQDLGENAKWNVRSLGAPHSYIDGENAIVAVVANVRSALTAGSGGFAGHAASAAAGQLGMGGRVYIRNETNPYPVNPETLKRSDTVMPGSLWGKTFTLSTRG